jgi:hypothetical protein
LDIAPVFEVLLVSTMAAKVRYYFEESQSKESAQYVWYANMLLAVLVTSLFAVSEYFKQVIALSGVDTLN